MKLKLASKIILATVLTIFALGSLATMTVFYYVHKSVLDVERENLLVLAKNSTLEIVRVLTDTKSVAETIVRQPEIKKYFDEPSVQDVDVLKLLYRYDINDRFSSIYVISRSGETLISTDPSFVGQNYSFREYFRNALAGNETVEVAVGVTSNELGYYIAVPVRNNNGDISGVLVLKLKAEIINSLVNVSGLSNSGHVMLVDDHGIVTYSDKSERTYKSLGSLDPLERKEIEKLKKYPNRNIIALDYGFVLEKIREKKKAGVLDIYDKIDSNQEILAYSQVGDYPFYLIFEEENKNFSLSAFRISFILGLFVFISAILAAIIIVITARRFLRPMNKILKFLRDISSGNVGKKIDIKTGDELEELSDVFNEMSDKIKEAKENIEKKVEQRTKELEKFNNLMVGRELRMIELKEEINDLKKKMEKKTLKGWTDRFGTGLNYEEEVIRDLESVYVYKIEASSLSNEKKVKIKKLLDRLIRESKKHNEIFKKLVKKHASQR